MVLAAGTTAGDRVFNHFNFNFHQLSTTLGLRLYNSLRAFNFNFDYNSYGSYFINLNNNNNSNDRRGLLGTTFLVVSSTATVLAFVFVYSSSIPSHLPVPFSLHFPFPSIFRFRFLCRRPTSTTTSTSISNSNPTSISTSASTSTTSSTTTTSSAITATVASRTITPIIGSSTSKTSTPHSLSLSSSPSSSSTSNSDQTQEEQMFSITEYIVSALSSLWNSSSSSSSSNGISNMNGVKRITGTGTGIGTGETDEERRIGIVMEALAPKPGMEELRLNKELEEVRKELEEFKRNEVLVIRQVKQVLEKENEGLKNDVDKLRIVCEELRKENEEVKNEREVLFGMHVEVEKLRKDKEVENDLLRKEYEEYVKMFNEKLSDVRKENEEIRERLGCVEEEKKGVESKLKTYLERDQDQVEKEEVVRLVQELNHDIDQVAGIISSSFQGRRLSQTLQGEEMNEAVSSVTEILGGRMVEMLLDGGEETVKMALQASMAAYVEWIVSSWCFENPEDEKFWNDIYGRVRQSEEPVVAGRWRSVTRKHLQQMKLSSSTATENDLKIYMFDAFANILIVAGYAADGQRVLEELVERFGDRVGAVLGGAQGLNRVVGEGIVSNEMEVVYVVPDEDYVASNMSIGGGEGVRVLCSTGLGVGSTLYGVVMKAVVVLYGDSG